MPGYIKLYRDLTNNPIWQKKPFSPGQAWTDIIFRCNHICKKVMGYGTLEWVLRGQFVSSNYKLAEAWGWSESLVRQFMKLLVSEDMLTILSTRHYSIFEVTKYCVFQSVEDTELQDIPNAQKTHRKRTSNAQKTLNNNDNNYNNDKKVFKEYVYLTDIEFSKLLIDFGETKTWDYIQRLNDYIKQIGVTAANKKYKSHDATIRNWERRDQKKETQSSNIFL